MPSLPSMNEILNELPSAFGVRCCGPSKPFANSRTKAIDKEGGNQSMRRSNFALRVPPTLLAEARKAAESEGVALNQLITLALAEKVRACEPKNTLRNALDALIQTRSAGFSLAWAREIPRSRATNFPQALLQKERGERSKRRIFCRLSRSSDCTISARRRPWGQSEVASTNHWTEEFGCRIGCN